MNNIVVKTLHQYFLCTQHRREWQVASHLKLACPIVINISLDKSMCRSIRIRIYASCRGGLSSHGTVDIIDSAHYGYEFRWSRGLTLYEYLLDTHGSPRPAQKKKRIDASLIVRMLSKSKCTYLVKGLRMSDWFNKLNFQRFIR